MFRLTQNLVQVDGVEPPESFKTMRLQRIPLPLRYKLAFKTIVESGGELHLIPSLSSSFPLSIAILRCPYSTKLVLEGS